MTHLVCFGVDMGSIRNEKFDFWQEYNKNVLLLGLSGTGKTTMLREALERWGLKIGETVAYYSPHDQNFVGDPTTAKAILFDNLNDPQAQKAAQEILGLGLWRGKPVTATVWGSSPYDTALLGAIDKAIKAKGFNSYVFSKTQVVVNSPPRSGQDRERVVAQINKLAEEARVVIRNIRKKTRQKAEEDIDKPLQKLTDEKIKEINNLADYKVSNL
jgi:hypothetical protein